MGVGLIIVAVTIGATVATTLFPKGFTYFYKFLHLSRKPPKKFVIFPQKQIKSAYNII